MATKEEIYQSLVDQVSSRSGSIWQSLSSSLVGKELLWYGAVLLYNQQEIANSINGVYDLSRVNSLAEVVRYAYAQNVPVDINRPASVVVRMYGTSGTVFPPFSVRLQVGTTTFYNIDYCSIDQDITLYMGRVCSMLSYFLSESDPLLTTLGSDVVSSQTAWQLYSELTEGRFLSSYVKLGQGVLSDSVRVFARSFQNGSGVGPVFPYTAWNANLSDPSALLYKVRMGWDYSSNVYFGDSNWAMLVSPELYHYQIVWLQGLTQRYSLPTSATIVVHLGDSIADRTYTRIQSESDIVSGSFQYIVKSNSEAEANSITYARNYVISKIFSSSGIVTETQILNFVQSFDTVSSALVTASLGDVRVTIKPQSANNVSFDFLEDFLYQYGVDGTTYTVTAGTPLVFNVVLTALYSDSSAYLSQAKSLVESYLSYDALTISSIVSASSVLQMLNESGIRGVGVDISLTEPLTVVGTTMNLSTSPLANTIRQTSPLGLLVGFDSDGTWLSLSGSPSVSGDVQLSMAGDFVYGSYNGASYLYDIDGSRLLAVSGATPFRNISGKFVSQSSGSLVFVSEVASDRKVYMYPNASSLQQGTYSIFTRTSYITPDAVYALELSSSLKLDLSRSFVYDGTYLYLPVTSDLGSVPCQVTRFALRTPESGSTPQFIADGITVGNQGALSNLVTLCGQYVFVPSDASISGTCFTHYYLFDPVTGDTIYGSVSYAVGTEPWYPLCLWFSGYSLYGLFTTEAGGEDVYLAQAYYEFTNNGQTMTLTVTQQSGKLDSSVDRILSISGGEVVLCTADGDVSTSTVYRGTISQISNSGISLDAAQMFVGTGSVDYSRGILYGVSASGAAVGSDTVSYVASGALVGSDGSYPVLGNVEIG